MTLQQPLPCSEVEAESGNRTWSPRGAGELQVLCSVIHLVSLSWGSRARARGPARIGLNAKSKQLSLEFIVRYLTASSAVVFPSSNLRVYSSLYGWRKKNPHQPHSSITQACSITLSCGQPVKRTDQPLIQRTLYPTRCFTPTQLCRFMAATF